MLAVLEVQLVEDTRSAFDVIQQVGPLLLAGAAILAAVMAWKSAGARLDKQLAHDRETQEKQLAHDRQLRRDEYRLNALDSALELVNELAKAVQEALGRHRFAESIWTSADKTLADPEIDETGKERAMNARSQVTDDLSAKSVALTERLPELSAAATRLRVRFGSAHQIPKLTDKLLKAWEVQRAKLSTATWPAEPLSEKEAAEWKADSAASAAAYAALMVACEAWLTSGEDH